MTARGFTLIELMIALALFAFLIMLAMPMYSDFMGNSQIRNAAENTYEGVRLAQQEAIKRNTFTQFVLDPATGWTVSFLDDEAGPGTYTVLQTYKFTEGAARATVHPHPVASTTATFNGLGRVVVPNPDASASLSWAEVTNTGMASPRNLHVVVRGVSADGTILTGAKVCDPDTGVAVDDPRYCPSMQ